MSPDNSAVPGDGTPAWEQMMRAMLGDGADEAIRELQERGFDPAAMAAASARNLARARNYAAGTLARRRAAFYRAFRVLTAPDRVEGVLSGAD